MLKTKNIPNRAKPVHEKKIGMMVSKTMMNFSSGLIKIFKGKLFIGRISSIENTSKKFITLTE